MKIISASRKKTSSAATDLFCGLTWTSRPPSVADFRKNLADAVQGFLAGVTGAKDTSLGHDETERL
jgi:hypothetical protein